METKIAKRKKTAVSASSAKKTAESAKRKKKTPLPEKEKKVEQKIAAGEEQKIRTEAEKTSAETLKPHKPDRYFEAVGRRKTAVARVRLFTKTGDFLVNGKPYQNYFPLLELRKIAEDAIQKMKIAGKFRITVKASGGGLRGQAEALRHGLARCLVKFNPDFRKRLKRAGFLKRDPRAKERKKFGLKKARRAPQWQKR